MEILRADFESIFENIDLLQSNNPNCILIILGDLPTLQKQDYAKS